MLYFLNECLKKGRFHDISAQIFHSGNGAKINTIKQKTSFMNKDIYCNGTYASIKLQKKSKCSTTGGW